MLQRIINSIEARATRPAKNAMIAQAFRLAFFIHRDPEIASQIVIESMIKLNSAAIAQDRRFYYEPAGRSSNNMRTRNRVTLGESHLLQRIIFYESQIWEKQFEQTAEATSIDNRQLIVHYIKHLVSITLKRNSFYVALGMTRLLCNYTTSEAMELYNQIVQDPARVKDDYYWRSRKGHLMQEVKERFGDLIKTCRGSRGEERFVACKAESWHATLVKECLDMFMPWNMICPLPAGSAPVRGEIPALMFKDDQPDREHHIELARIHAILHLNCFERLIEGLGLPAFFTRMELPSFFSANSSNQSDLSNSDDHQSSPPHGLNNLAEPEVVDLAAIQRKIEQYEELRRRSGSSAFLRILVDGIERARLEPGHNTRIRIEIEESAEMIEVRTAKSLGDILLATHLLSYDEMRNDSRPAKFETRLGRGRKISFTISSLASPKDGPDSLNVMVGHHFTNPLLSLKTQVAEWWRQSAEGNGKDAIALRYTTSIVLFILTATIGALLFFSRQTEIQSPLIATTITPGPVSQDHNPTPSDNSETPLSTAPSSKKNGSVGPTNSSKEASRHWPQIQLPGIPKHDNATRDINDAPSSTSLLAVRKIYVELDHEKLPDTRLYDCLVEQIAASRRWIAASIDDADTAMIVSTSSDLGGVTVKLINENGHVIWPYTRKQPRIYRGSNEQMAAAIVAELLSELNQSEKATKQ